MCLRLPAQPGHVFAPLSEGDLAKIAAAIPQRAAKPLHPRRLLVFFRTEGYVHDSIPFGNEALKEMGEKTGAYTADFSDDMAVFTPENLKQYDGILFNSTTKLAFADPAQRQALLDFVKSGKGFMGIHAATDNFYTWPEGAALIGGTFQSHPWHADATEAVKVDEPAHTLTAAFGGKGFWINDEIYQLTGPYDRSRVRVLLSLDMSKAQNQRNPKEIVRTDGDFPISWIKNVDGGGRVFYCSLGHNSDIYWTPQVLQYYLAGIQFALGDLAADATPSAQLNPQPQPALAPDTPAPLNPLMKTQPKTGGPAFEPARFDQQALDASVGGITVPNRDELRQPPITVECWALLHDDKDYNILVASDAKASSQHWELCTQKDTGFFGAFLPGMGGDFASSKAICDGHWHDVAMILESNRVRLYVDGEMVKDSPLTAPTGTPRPGDVGIGKLVEGGFGCDGDLQDVRISRGVRDVSQVSVEPLQRDATTLELWPLDGTSDPAPPGISTGLPMYKVIPAATPAQLTPANGWPPASSYTDWTRSNGGSTSNRYVSHTEINKANVAQMTQAWVYHSKDGVMDIECNPIFVDDMLFVPTAGLSMVALDGATGREVWRFKPEKQGNGLEDVPARRGLIYWAGDAANPGRILFTMGTWIYALDPKTGQPVTSFGQGGRAPLPRGGSSVAPVIYKNVLIYPGFTNGVFGYDVRTGQKLWTFNTLPRGREFGAATWDTDQRDGANDWGGISLDESRGIVYAATGSPKPNFLGMLHTGDNLFGNCVLALDALSGRLLWYFQDVRHDVWDLDIPAPPNLVTVQHGGMKVDAVAVVSKGGDPLLLDRVSGKPLFPFRLKRAPDFKLPGDRGALYQPDLELPERLVRQEFTLDDVTDRTPEAHAAVTKIVEQASHGWYSPFEDNKPNVYFGVDGGGEWTGASVDPAGKMYIGVSDFPWILNVHRVQDSGNSDTALGAAGQEIYAQSCAACHQPDRGGNGFAPSLLGLGARLKADDVRQILHHGRNAMPPQPQLTEDQITALCSYLLDSGAKNQSGPPRWTFDGYNHLNDPQGYPGSKPPWGKLVCLDLNTGHITWQVPLGEYPELTAAGVPKTGTSLFAGPSVTATGLIFVSGSRDATIGAYDCDNGKELWSHALPLHGTAPCIIYQTHGHEYVAVSASGGGRLGGHAGDAWVAFALPAGVAPADASAPATPPPPIIQWNSTPAPIPRAGKN